MADFDPKTKEVFMEFTHLVSWSGEEYTYTITIIVDEESIVQKILPLKCERLSCDDAFGSNYRGKRIDEYDYYRLDCVLNPAVSDS